MLIPKLKKLLKVFLRKKIIQDIKKSKENKKIDLMCFFIKNYIDEILQENNNLVKIRCVKNNAEDYRKYLHLLFLDIHQNKNKKIRFFLATAENNFIYDFFIFEGYSLDKKKSLLTCLDLIERINHEIETKIKSNDDCSQMHHLLPIFINQITDFLSDLIPELRNLNLSFETKNFNNGIKP